jgi:two-component system chemotaxis response regulator CheB
MGDGLLGRRIDAVVIGASAGGVDALSAVLPALPSALQAPVFVVLHLPRDRPSVLANIFAAKCRVPVREAGDKDAIDAGTIYFAPPDYHLLIEQDRTLALSSDEPVHHSRPSIDVLFESAAEVYGRGLLGVVLTGGNADGADGLDAVRRGGGVTAVQDPAGAYAPYMIEAALARGTVDYLLPLTGLADLLRTVDPQANDR